MQQPPYGYPQQPLPMQQPPKKGMSTAAKILIGLAGVFVLGAGSCVVCVGLGAKGVADGVAKKDAKNAEARKLASVIPIEELLSSYKGNEVKADGTFKGRYAIVSGKVDSIKKDLADSMYVTLGTGKMLEIPQIQCHLNADQTQAASSLTKGQQATVVGRVDGLMMNVQLRDCSIQ